MGIPVDRRRAQGEAAGQRLALHGSEGTRMFRMKRRLLAVAALSALALSQVLPVSATTVNFTYGSCSASGYSTRPGPYSASGTSGTSGCWKSVQMTWFDPVSASYIARTPLSGFLLSYQDDIGWDTALFSYHRIGVDIANYTQRTTSA